MASSTGRETELFSFKRFFFKFLDHLILCIRDLCNPCFQQKNIAFDEKSLRKPSTNQESMIRNEIGSKDPFHNEINIKIPHSMLDIKDTVQSMLDIKDTVRVL